MGATGIDDDQPPPPRAMKRPPVLLVAGQIVLALTIAVATVLLVMHLREQALTEAGREQGRIALVLADQTERAFEAVELVQMGIHARLRNDGVETPEGFRQLASNAAIRQELRGRGLMLPQLDAIIITDAAGDVINSSRPGFSAAPRVNVADRDFYEGLKAHPERTMFISEPVRNRTNGEWTMYIAHKVAGPDGTFLGIIEGAVALPYFEHLYRSVASGKDSSVGLFRQDGTLLARYPPLDMAARPAAARSVYPQILSATGADSTVVRGAGLFDLRDRVIAGHALVHYPVVVTVTNTTAAILTAWHQQAAWLVGAAAILEAVVVSVGMLMLRQLRGQLMLQAAQAATARADASRLRAEAELVVAHERERADQELGLQNLRFRAALDNMSHALCLFDSSDRLVVANARHAAMFGMNMSRITPGATAETLMRRADGESNLSHADVQGLLSGFRELKQAGQRACRVRELTDGRILATNFVPVENDGWLVTVEDITERRAAAARITHIAHHDALTGLPNRSSFHHRLSEAVARSRRGEGCAVLYLDLDHFKAVNDTLGHPVGDLLLQEVTRRLHSQIRETDTVARLGGDEFAIMQSSVNQPQDATALATRLVDVIGAPYQLEGQPVVTGTSIGIALVPADGEDPDQILKNADMALYRAKADGRARYRFFTPDMDARAQARRALEIDLRKALAGGEFELFYQPLVNLRTDTITGFEALMRWFHPRRGMIAPADFIPVAEEIGLLVPLGAWALRRACCDAVTWPGDRKVAVNVSVTQFASPTLVDDVAGALAASGLAPHRLELEITETVMLDETDATTAILHRLRDLGVGIAMDDFGTGYSSLSYLRRFPFSKVKIDQSFVAGLGKGGDCDAIVASVTDLCTTLGMIALAEGVETEDQLRRLRAGNCGEAQGYLFGRPRPADEVAALCAAQAAPKLVAV